VNGGSRRVAQSKPELARIRAQLDADRAFGLGEDDVARLDADETRPRVRVAGALGATFTPHCARMQPAKLVRGLAESVERRGATIYEGTAVTVIEPHVARTARGEVRARWIVRATEGYTATLRGLRRVVMPVNSAMIATRPLGADAWRELGWDGLETILSGRHLYAYLQRTADGRIAIGGRGIPYGFGSKSAREGPLPQ